MIHQNVHGADMKCALPSIAWQADAANRSAGWRLAAGFLPVPVSFHDHRHVCRVNFLLT